MKIYIKEILEKRSALSKEDYEKFSVKIRENIENLKEYKEADSLLTFYPYHNEVDILPLILQAIASGKKVYFPKVTGETTMEFIRVHSLEDFSSGYKGIKEPSGNEVFSVKEENGKVCMIAPGSAFDKMGNRCGYGKGYYDRYLENCPKNMTIIGVCFFLQLLEIIPDIKPTDIPMDYVINENETIRSQK